MLRSSAAATPASPRHESSPFRARRPCSSRRERLAGEPQRATAGSSIRATSGVRRPSSSATESSWPARCMPSPSRPWSSSTGLIRDNEIDAELRTNGWLELAWAPGHAAEFGSEAMALEQFGMRAGVRREGRPPDRDRHRRVSRRPDGRARRPAPPRESGLPVSSALPSGRAPTCTNPRPVRVDPPAGRRAVRRRDVAGRDPRR